MIFFLLLLHWLFIVGEGLDSGLCSATINNRFTGQVSNEFAPEEDSPLQSKMGSMLKF